MKIMSWKVLAVVASVIVAAWVGVAPAAEKEGASAWSLEHAAALETGSLPPSPGSVFGPGSKASVDAPVIEVGGRFYRVGVDTQ